MTSQDSRRRLEAVVHREPVDRTPFICPGGMMNMAVVDAMGTDGEWPTAHDDAEAMAALATTAQKITGFDNIGLPFCMTIEAEGLGAEVYRGTHETEPRVSSYVMDDMTETDRLTAFDPSAGRAAVTADAVRRVAALGNDLPIVVCLTGPVSLATSLIEPLTFYRALRRAPEQAHRLLEVCTDALVDFGDVLVDAGADVLCIADPSATGELLGKAAFTDFAAPYIDDVTRHFAERGRPTIVHVCGDATCLGETLDRLETPVVSVDSIVRLDVLRQAAPSKALMGNLSTSLLEFGRDERVADAARACARRGAEIVAPACGIGARTPAANLRAAAAALREDSR
jgi:[methyl-Co(III) methanol-specific corrinoid protein]:coenzyme M methyltransferase